MMHPCDAVCMNAACDECTMDMDWEDFDPAMCEDEENMEDAMDCLMGDCADACWPSDECMGCWEAEMEMDATMGPMDTATVFLIKAFGQDATMGGDDMMMMHPCDAVCMNAACDECTMDMDWEDFDPAMCEDEENMEDAMDCLMGDCADACWPSDECM